MEGGKWKSPKISSGRTEKDKQVTIRRAGGNPSTVSKWCTNSSQPDIETLAKIAKLLKVGVEELYNEKFMESV